MKFFDLRKRVAFITGGNGGIGLGMAKGLVGAGATVVETRQRGNRRYRSCIRSALKLSLWSSMF
jgi:NAD(P)-dependent dehydrogenase (short-subunit alcohol dehydrogenase family)